MMSCFRQHITGYTRALWQRFLHYPIKCHIIDVSALESLGPSIMCPWGSAQGQYGILCQPLKS